MVIGKMRKILLVDDDPVLLEIGIESLSAAGFDVKSASNGQEAVPIIQNGNFDLLVMDIEMPLLNGLSLLKWVRASTDNAIASLPVIMVTGRNDERAIQTCYDFGATSYIAKPVSWLNMMHQIAFVLRSSDNAVELREAHEAELKLSQAKDGLMMSLRHELRSPLHIIQGFSTLLSQGSSERLSNDEKQSLEMIDQTVDDMATKLGRLFLYAETLAGDFDLTADFTTAARIANKAIKATSRLSEERRVTVEFDVQDNIPVECNVDEEKLVIALSEILDNAVRLTPGGGLVTITMNYEQDGELAFTVEDEGPGVNPEQIASLFEPFVQSDGGLTRTSVGVGLGLTVSQSIVARHGGSIVLENRPENGAKVTIRFPSEQPLAQRSAA